MRQHGFPDARGFAWADARGPHQVEMSHFSGHQTTSRQCPLLGVKRTSP
jgi:hypothetical protein